MTLNTLAQYGTGFQIKVLSSLLTHKEFLTNINDVLSEEYFDNSAHRWVINEIIKYYSKYHTTPTMEVLKTEMKKIEKSRKSIGLKLKNRVYFFKSLLWLSISYTISLIRVRTNCVLGNLTEKQMMKIQIEKHYSTKFYLFPV